MLIHKLYKYVCRYCIVYLHMLFYLAVITIILMHVCLAHRADFDDIVNEELLTLLHSLWVSLCTEA